MKPINPAVFTEDANHIAWAAGLIDGEGCINIKKSSKRNYYSLVLTVRMTHRPTIERLMKFFPGGSFHVGIPALSRHSPAYTVNWQGGVADFILRLIRNHLFTKAEEAEFGIAFQELKRRARRKVLDRAKCDAGGEYIYWRLRTLKSRYRKGNLHESALRDHKPSRGHEEASQAGAAN